jgi:NAD(P)-dependent dehydrogenase (short-subunit alcohol dehydrogenase family)
MAALLAGKSAAITGGVTGIGRAIALGYLRQGAAVTVNFLDDAPSWKHFESLKAEAPADSKLHGVTGDVGIKATGEAIVRGAVNEHGALDIANAGVSQFRDFITCVRKAHTVWQWAFVSGLSDTPADSTRKHSILISTPISRDVSGRRKRRHGI